MVIKKLRIPLLLLMCVLLVSAAMSLTASAAAGDLPAGFSGDKISSVDFAANNKYPWHKMTEEEATEFELTDFNGADDPVVYIAGNSGKDKLEESASNLVITVTGPGTLRFEYAISAFVGTSMTRDHFSYRFGWPIEDDASVLAYNRIAQGEMHPTDGQWNVCEINIDDTQLAEKDYVAVYLAYVHSKGYDTDTHLNYVAIRNVEYISGSRNDVVRGYDTAMGTVTVEDADINALSIGVSYTFTATAKQNYQFYGWVKHKADGSKELVATKDGKLNVLVDLDSYYEPVFALKDTYGIRNGAVFYENGTSLKSVIESAKAGDVVALLEDYTLTENITVPADVTLYIPYHGVWEAKEAEGKYCLNTDDQKVCHTRIAGEDETFVRLTIPENVSLNVNGHLAIGSVIGFPSQRYQGHVSGMHGRITNNGTIEVLEGGVMTCYGPVDGGGKVYVNDNAILKESFIIGDFAGGSNSAQLFGTSQMPFKRFSVQSVQCQLEMEAKAFLKALVNLWALSAHNNVEITLVGDDGQAAFRPNGAKEDTIALTRTYEPEMSLTDGNGLLDVTGIGCTNWTFSSGLTFQPFTFNLGGLELDTGNSDFTIPYNFKINLISGTYNIPIGIRIMPGGEVTVGSGATVIIGGRLMILDGLVQTDMSGDRYPNRSELEAKGFSGSGELVVNGTMILQKGASLGGLVKSDGSGKIIVEEGVYLSNSADLDELDITKDLSDQEDRYSIEGGIVIKNELDYVIRIDNWVQQDGSRGAYDENTTWFNLPAMLYTREGVQPVEEGKTYQAVKLDTPENAEYSREYLYVPDGTFGALGNSEYGYLNGTRKMNRTTENLSREMNSVWVDSEKLEDLAHVEDPVVFGGKTEGSLSYNATVAYEAEKSGTDTLLKNLRVVDKTSQEARQEKYVLRVKYTKEGEETEYTVEPVEGVYTVPFEAYCVTIEACILGDVNGDGFLAAGDANSVSLHVAKKVLLEGMPLLAADVNSDGYIAAGDANSISLHLAKKVFLFPVN